MKERLKTLRKNRSGGFTLVELIVVLIILAILAALLVPALTGYINKAKEKQVIAEARSCVMAAQTIVDERYAAGTTPNGFDSATPVVNPVFNATTITDLAEVDGQVTGVKIDANTGKITELVYHNGKYCKYTSNTKTYEVSDSTLTVS